MLEFPLDLEVERTFHRRLREQRENNQMDLLVSHLPRVNVEELFIQSIVNPPENPKLNKSNEQVNPDANPILMTNDRDIAIRAYAVPQFGEWNLEIF